MPSASRSKLPSSSVLVSSSIQSAAVGVLDDPIEDLDGQRLAASYAPHQGLCFPLPRRLNVRESPPLGRSRAARTRTECHNHRTGSRRTRSATRSSSSSEVRSLQCASSNRNSIGRCCARLSNCRTSATRSARASVAGRPAVADSARRPAPTTGRRIRPRFPDLCRRTGTATQTASRVSSQGVIARKACSAL